jgi:hypothetical protein
LWEHQTLHSAPLLWKATCSGKVNLDTQEAYSRFICNFNLEGYTEIRLGIIIAIGGGLKGEIIKVNWWKGISGPKREVTVGWRKLRTAEFHKL